MQEIHVVLVLMPSPSTIHIGLISTTPETIDIAVFLIVYRSARLPKLKRQYQGGKKTIRSPGHCVDAAIAKQIINIPAA